MATCKDCIHEKVCNTLSPKGLLPYQSSDYPSELFCLEFKNKADVIEVKHGFWKKEELLECEPVFLCSICEKLHDQEYSYCNNCGAKMEVRD